MWATVTSWSLKMLARIGLLLAPGNEASAYVAPCAMLFINTYSDAVL